MRLLVFSLVLLAGLGAAGWYWAYPAYTKWQMRQAMLAARPKVVKAKDGTSTSPAWHNLRAYRKSLRDNYSFVYQAAYQTPKRTTVGQDVVIPGLISTRSYDYQSKKLTTATAMTPQGIAVVYNYILITAYDGQHRHASVIYVLDKKTGKFLKTVRLPGRQHLGGIAYDPKGMRIWLTGSMDGKSALMSFTLAKLIEYVSEAKSSDQLVYDQEIPINSIAKASALTYYADQLFVGYFSESGHGKVASYKLARSGKYKNTITTSEITSINESVSWSDPDGTTSMNKQIQGLAIYGDKIFLSQSYGSKDSKLYIFPITAVDNLDESNAEQVVRMPPYLEQITVYRGQLLCLFESASSQYARQDITVMDRTLSVNINALLNNN
nr:hypothetical protein [Lactobacillus nasalidis]